MQHEAVSNYIYRFQQVLVRINIANGRLAIHAFRKGITQLYLFILVILKQHLSFLQNARIT